MLIKCPECALQVSDKAVSCPHCGYPLKPEAKNKSPCRRSKRRRLPNGFGQISEIRNHNLRNPFRAMVTVGKDENGRPICKSLKPQAYFATYNEAYAALVEYNKNPYDLGPSITVRELYDKWSEGYFKTIKSTKNVSSAWAYCSSVYGMRVVDVRARHIKGVIDSGFVEERGKKRYPTPIQKSRIKSLFNMMLDYAVEYEIVDRNYARTFTLSEEITKELHTAKNGHIPFSDEELEILWEHVTSRKYVDVILIQCYSGWRPKELLSLRLEDVDLDSQTIRGGMKTEAGTNRIVPIHPRILPLIEGRYREAVSLGSEYLLNCTDTTRTSKELTYRQYEARFNQIKAELKLDSNHRPHDGRVCFVTRAKKYGVDEYAIKYMVGHAITDITERVYTKREIEWLRSEIEKIR